MSVLIFPSEKVLQLAMTSNLVPVEVQATTARIWVDDEGTITVAPGRRLDQESVAALKRAGVTSRGSAPRGDGREVGCWPAILSPVRLDEDALATALVLFALPPGASVLTLAEELLRLGCDRQDFCFLAEGEEPSVLLRAQRPPYYTVARALDRPGGLRAYSPASTGQERIWIEVGYAHPLSSGLQAPDGQLLLIDGEGGWRTISVGSWTGIYQLLDVRLPDDATQHRRGLPQRLSITLRLSPSARSATPTLWVVREQAARFIDQLVQQLPENEIGRLLFATTGGPGQEVVILRARSGRGAPPVLEVPGEAYATWLDVNNLFLPCDAILEPPLRRETLRGLLSPDAEQVTWLVARDGNFAVERIAEAAFAPLEEWVEYVVHSQAATLQSWVRSAVFELEAYESIGGEWAEQHEEREQPEREERKPKRPRGRYQEAPIEEERPPIAEEAPATYTPRASAADEAPEIELAPRGVEEAELTALEQAFIDSPAAADDPERARMWLEMSRLNTTLGRQHDAGLCWTRAVWEADDGAVRGLCERWAAAEARMLGREAGPALIAELVQNDGPTTQQARVLASQLAWVGLDDAAPPRQLAAAQVWLNAHDESLDVRSTWIGHLALARLSGGDTLQLARTRDRILARLYRGLSVERDVPTFLRFCGGGAANATTVAQLGEQLVALLDRFRMTKRKRKPTEAPEEVTRGYVLMLFAAGFARLAQPELARTLRIEATQLLASKDEIRTFLHDAYSARVEQAIAGLPLETPLPPELAGRLNELPRFRRYIVDRLREASTILEPHEHLEPTDAFVQAKTDPRGEELAPMRGMTDAEQLARAVSEVMGKALDVKTAPEDRDRLFDGVMDFFPLLPEAEAVPHLRALVGRVDDLPGPRRCLLLEEALMLSGFFGRAELVRELVARLGDLIGELGGEHAAKVAKTLGQCMRSLRRVGLLDEAARLLGAAHAAISGSGTDEVVGRLQLASGLADLERLEEARGAFRDGAKALEDKALLMVDRLKITRAMALALSHMPQAYALGGLSKLGDQLVLITDAYNTNPHFCLSVIQFMESLILGYASEQLALGELGRKWLDDDEYLVRRRIHRDLQRAEEHAR
jgi:cellulose synthase operon protein C